jgi:hypothetical protein
MQFNSQTTIENVVEKSFTVDDVPGVLWAPAAPCEPTPLVLMGHPGGLHKRAPGLVARATRLVSSFGFRVAAIDAPGHGERQRSASDSAWVDRMQRARRAGEHLGAIVSEFNASIAERAVPEWRATLDAQEALDEVDSGRPVGYSGMTLATEIGFRLAAADERIGALGLGAAFASDALEDVARRVAAPVLYLLPWDDQEIDRDSGLALFDAIGATDKVLHVFPGPHERVPSFEADDAARFLARHLMPEVESRQPM